MFNYLNETLIISKQRPSIEANKDFVNAIEYFFNLNKRHSNTKMYFSSMNHFSEHEALAAPNGKLEPK